jgi:hypothetical protein
MFPSRLIYKPQFGKSRNQPADKAVAVLTPGMASVEVKGA